MGGGTGRSKSLGLRGPANPEPSPCTLGRAGCIRV